MLAASLRSMISFVVSFVSVMLLPLFYDFNLFDRKAHICAHTIAHPCQPVDIVALFVLYMRGSLKWAQYMGHFLAFSSCFLNKLPAKNI